MWPSSLVPTSDNLVNKVQKISFIISKILFHLTVHLNITIIQLFVIIYLSSNRKGLGAGKIPWPGQLAPHP